jgi:mycothiol synthase
VHRVDVKRRLDETDVEAVQTLAGAASVADQFRDLPAAFAGLLAYDDDRPIGYAHLTREPSGWSLRLVVADPTIGADLVGTAIAVVKREGGGYLRLWVTRPGSSDDELAAASGLTERRDLYQMRRPLPVGEPWELETRPFRPGLDDAAWLVVNNRAFAWHPEQGGWDEATLKAREAEPWFDPEGFLLHEENGRLAGFCWTKIHADEHPPLGEIYVIAADPDWHGTGLGRRLTLAGLDYLARKGLTVGMLYVDASNTAAVNLYDRLGFTIDHIDRAYGGDIGAGRPAGGGLR